MNEITKKKQRKPRGWRWKIPLGLLVLLFVGLFLAILNINSIAHTQINQALKRFFSEGGTLDAIDIQLKAGRIELAGLTINPPQGYGIDPLLSLNTLELDVDITSLFSGEIVVEKLHLKGVSVIVARDKQGQLSPVKLVKPVAETSEPEPIDKGDEQTLRSIPAIRVNSIRLDDVSVRLIDQLAEEQWSAGLRLNLAVDDLQIRDLLNRDILVGKVNLALSAIKVDQPPGFGPEKLASLERLAVTTDGLDLASPELVIKQVLVQGLASAVTVHRDGSSNLQKLKKMLRGTAKEKGPNKAQPEDETDISTTENGLPAVRIEQIQMESASLHYRDEALTAEALVFPMENLKLNVAQLRLFDNNAAADPAAISVSFQLKQPGKLPTAYFGTVAAMGPVNRGIPPTNAQVRLIGLKLDTLGSLIPPATRTAVGADGLDTGLALALNNGRISLNALALTDRNIRYDTIKVQGSLDAPVVKIAPIFAGVFRVTDGLLSIGKRGLGTGVSLAEGGFDVAKEVGSGTLKIGKKLVTGLFDTGTGLVTLDQKQVKKGLAGSTRDTIDLSMDSVKGAGMAAGVGLGTSVSDLTGDAALQAWDKGIPSRYQTAMQRAQKALAKMPYPPVTK